MIELIQFAIEPVNLFFTLLLGLIGLYWLSVLLGLLDIDSFDLDLGGDGDVDGAEASGLFRAFAEFFSLGHVPFMVLLTILFLNFWMFAILGNYYFNPNHSMLLALVIALPGFVIACGITKVLLIPIAKVFDNLDGSDEAARPIIGQVGTVTTTEVSSKLGQVEITTHGSPILLNVISANDRVFHKGDEAVIVGKDDTRGVYLIAPLKVETQSC